MARAYSNDSQRKFFHTYDAGEDSLADLAERFQVSPATGWRARLNKL
jgi:transposase